MRIVHLLHRRVFCYKLEADARRYLLRYFVTVATQSDEFLHLPLDELNSIILEDELNVKSEEVVWEAVLRWVNYDPDIRWQHTVKLMGSIRLGLLDTQVSIKYLLFYQLDMQTKLQMYIYFTSSFWKMSKTIHM